MNEYVGSKSVHLTGKLLIPAYPMPWSCGLIIQAETSDLLTDGILAGSVAAMRIPGIRMIQFDLGKMPKGWLSKQIDLYFARMEKESDATRVPARSVDDVGAEARSASTCWIFELSDDRLRAMNEFLESMDHVCEKLKIQRWQVNLNEMPEGWAREWHRKYHEDRRFTELPAGQRRPND